MKAHGDLDKTYLFSLGGTDEWNTKKMKIKLYCKVPNDIFITILFCLLIKPPQHNNYSCDTLLLNQSLSLTLDGQGKAGNEYFLFCYHLYAPSGYKGFWRL